MRARGAPPSRARDAAGVDLEPAFENALALAPSNPPELGDGRRVHEGWLDPAS